MNSERWVPISIIAGFKKVKAITGDIQEVVSALRRSHAVVVDDSGTMVKPVAFEKPRTTIILRDLPLETESEEIASLFAEAHCPAKSIRRETVGNMWFVEFSTAADALAMLNYTRGKRLRDVPIAARLKSNTLLSGGEYELIPFSFDVPDVPVWMPTPAIVIPLQDPNVAQWSVEQQMQQHNQAHDDPGQCQGRNGEFDPCVTHAHGGDVHNMAYFTDVKDDPKPPGDRSGEWSPMYNRRPNYHGYHRRRSWQQSCNRSSQNSQQHERPDHYVNRRLEHHDAPNGTHGPRNQLKNQVEPEGRQSQLPPKSSNISTPPKDSKLKADDQLNLSMMGSKKKRSKNKPSKNRRRHDEEPKELLEPTEDQLFTNEDNARFLDTFPPHKLEKSPKRSIMEPRDADGYGSRSNGCQDDRSEQSQLRMIWKYIESRNE
ncbi:hypothetical protein BCR41DRAFT_367536 [Lobosporangium transversale]|uniref:HTH La-type RNA-binding domain-containing protein n=1 Tax=Lobosporangium transversale TaxID=64571 RepID=A0A1Y2H1W9_9FUNG|nr:hypothetical protein BCR41DRAFT_367536 [Lobosporangium transversale]ORZ28014.1 hypothetical protein BCR41DRAFT_367536 [Lobosporangium transversale]|eukprot:XP_021885717.1 hypothetical protein BCR41DRAFT_367536 [Lobosporangium transversale]